jgi:hypothetical protein
MILLYRYHSDSPGGLAVGSGSPSRRKFLKRTGGATAAAVFGLAPSKITADEESNQSVEWNMDWLYATGIANTGLEKYTLPDPTATPPLQALTLGNDSFDILIKVYYAPIAVTNRTNTLQTRLDADFTVTLSGGPAGFQPVTLFHKAEVTVNCDSTSGVMTNIISYVIGADGQGPLVEKDFTHDGDAYKLQLLGSPLNMSPTVFNAAGDRGDGYCLARAYAGITKVGVQGHLRIPQLIQGQPATYVEVANFFRSKKII